MKEKKIYKGDLLVAFYHDCGWIVLSNEKKWIRLFLKRNKDNIHKSDTLQSLVRRCYFCDIMDFLENKFLLRSDRGLFHLPCKQETKVKRGFESHP